MADAPSGGGSGWGPFEIILGLLLAIGLLSNIGNKGDTYKPLEIKENNKQAISAKPSEDTSSKCGLSVTSPISFQKVKDNVHLSGLVKGCNWEVKDGNALFAQVINASGSPVSEFINVPESGSDLFNSNFDINIDINSGLTGTGYLILIPASQKDKSITFRIPLTFVRN